MTTPAAATDASRAIIAASALLTCCLLSGCGSAGQAERAASASPTPEPAATAVAADAPLDTDRDASDDAAKTPADLRVRPRLTRRAGGVLDLTFDDLEFEIERDGDFRRELLGEPIEALKGKSVILRGFILGASVFQQKGIRQFVLVRDNQECCFGPGAYIFHNAQVEMSPGNSCDFSIRPVTVEGKFDIRPFLGPGGKCYSVYHITADRVK